MPKGGYGEGGQVAFSEQMTFSQIFEINEDELVTQLFGGKEF